MICLKSIYLKNYIYSLLNKSIDSPLFLEELDSIETLSLDCFNFRGVATDVVIEDLIYFRNLKFCCLQYFNITDREIIMLNRCSNLRYLQFFHCSFSHLKQKLVNSIETLYFVHCTSLSLSFICYLPHLHILGISDMKTIKLKGLEKLFELHTLYLQNIKELNIAPLRYVPGLLHLNLDGSSIKNKKLLEKFEIYMHVEASDFCFLSDSNFLVPLNNNTI